MKDWPQPVEALNEAGASDVVLLCEHAANHVPDEYRSLGLEAPELERHIAFDLGAADVTRRLAALIDAPAFLGTYSRLLIDLNRPLGRPSSIPMRSESTDIPGNIGIPPGEFRRRADTIFTPFHRHVAEFLDVRRAEQRPTRIVTIHSFTPVFLGEPRPWQAGVLFDNARAFGWKTIERMAAPGLLIDANVPYETDRNEDYAVPVHGDDRGIPAILIEIRNDLLGRKQGIDEWASRIARAVTAVDG